MNPCTLCGAQWPDSTCEERFWECLVLEFDLQQAYGTVHHLTVPSYMLQHNLYSAFGWLPVAKLLSDFVSGRTTPMQVRADVHGSPAPTGQRRSIVKGEKFAGFGTIAWTRTIADVRLTDAEEYCSDVRLWAKSIVADIDRAGIELPRG